MNAHMEKALRMMAKESTHLASSTRDLAAFLCLLEANPQDLTSSSCSRPTLSQNVRKVNVVISHMSSQEIDEQVGKSKETCRYFYTFFQNSSSSPSSSRKTGSSSKSKDTINGIPSDSPNDTPCNPPYDNQEPKQKDSTDIVDPSFLIDSSSPVAIE